MHLHHAETNSWSETKSPDGYQNSAAQKMLTHWDRVTLICAYKLTIIDSENALSPRRRQAIIWTNDGKSS